ncbi:hypothetical protein CROQUDRAFT_88657 [Cronartium quercuum f. sp. fusiforme G11]|uniref:Uncharacterized protein n=1 Tax=Cronartium quercuum f. sp. fusiforme G11 TaxID=708437 RepID=A0A9P6NUK6_9BASI|nr:hypothetical protein CROQUDRAFT_88657 [Cronartium quercuum f. sp. fusiforme G11]
MVDCWSEGALSMAYQVINRPSRSMSLDRTVTGREPSSGLLASIRLNSDPTNLRGSFAQKAPRGVGVRRNISLRIPSDNPPTRPHSTSDTSTPFTSASIPLPHSLNLNLDPTTSLPTSTLSE